MAKKKKAQSKVVGEQADGTKVYGFESEVKTAQETPTRDLSDANAGIKDHAKFDKFKKGDDVNGN